MASVSRMQILSPQAFENLSLHVLTQKGHTPETIERIIRTFNEMGGMTSLYRGMLDECVGQESVLQALGTPFSVSVRKGWKHPDSCSQLAFQLACEKCWKGLRSLLEWCAVVLS